MVKILKVLIILLCTLSIAKAVSAGEIAGSRLSTAWNDVFFVNSDNSLWTWGAEPSKLMDSVQSVAVQNYGASLRSAFVIKTDWTLWAWGDPSYGRLGCGDSVNGQRIQQPVKVLDSVSQIVTGNWNSMAIKTDGSLWGCGDNSHGQLGLGDLSGRSVFTKIMDDVTSVGIYSVSDDTVGSDFTLAVKKDGSLWAFGGNWTGMFGNGKRGGDIHTYDVGVDSNIPIKIMDGVRSVAMKGNRCYIIKNDNSLWDLTSREDNSWKALGTPPVKVMDNAAFVSCGETHTIAIKTDGSLWAWGGNQDGQIGDGTQTYYPSGGAATAGAEAVLADKEYPVKIMEEVIEASAGYGISTALRADGSVWEWGALPLSNSLVPVKVINPGALPVKLNAGELKLVFTVGAKSYTRNGTELYLAKATYISADDRAMVPIRIIAQELGAIVEWDAFNMTASVILADVSLAISLDKPLPNNHGQAWLIPSNEFYSWRLLVPVRYIAENLGAKVEWNPADKTITIKK